MDDITFPDDVAKIIRGYIWIAVFDCSAITVVHTRASNAVFRNHALVPIILMTLFVTILVACINHSDQLVLIYQQSNGIGVVIAIFLQILSPFALSTEWKLPENVRH